MQGDYSKSFAAFEPNDTRVLFDSWDSCDYTVSKVFIFIHNFEITFYFLNPPFSWTLFGDCKHLIVWISIKYCHQIWIQLILLSVFFFASTRFALFFEQLYCCCFCENLFYQLNLPILGLWSWIFLNFKLLNTISLVISIVVPSGTYYIGTNLEEICACFVPFKIPIGMGDSGRCQATSWY